MHLNHYITSSTHYLSNFEHSLKPARKKLDIQIRKRPYFMQLRHYLMCNEGNKPEKRRKGSRLNCFKLSKQNNSDGQLCGLRCVFIYDLCSAYGRHTAQVGRFRDLGY